MEWIRKSWQNFQKIAVPASAPPVQRRQMRKSFYAGYGAMLTTAKKLAEAGDEFEINLILREIEAEYREFLKEIRREMN